MLVKPPRKLDDIYKNIIEKTLKVLYTPLTAVDHLFKYNIFFKYYYYTFMDYFIAFLYKRTHYELKLLIIIFQIIPRIILVFLLLKDTFWIFKVDIFYSFIFIGIIPFIHKYVKYSVKDLKMHYIEILDKKYEDVSMMDKAYMDPGIEWKLTEENKHHRQHLLLKSYIEFKIEQAVYQKSKVEYEENQLAFEEIYVKYNIEKYGYGNIELTDDDYINIHKDYNNFMPKILKLGIFHEMYSILEQDVWIKRMKLLIFGSYFFCWSFILCISYFHFPIDFPMMLYYLNNINKYLYEEFAIISNLDEYYINKLLLYKMKIQLIMINIYALWEIKKITLYKITIIFLGIVLLLNLIRKVFEKRLIKKNADKHQ
jgi:hypothetical protein